MTQTIDYEKGIKILKEQYKITLIFLTLGSQGSRVYYRDLVVEEKPFLQKKISTHLLTVLTLSVVVQLEQRK